MQPVADVDCPAVSLHNFRYLWVPCAFIVNPDLEEVVVPIWELKGREYSGEDGFEACRYTLPSEPYAGTLNLQWFAFDCINKTIKKPIFVELSTSKVDRIGDVYTRNNKLVKIVSQEETYSTLSDCYIRSYTEMLKAEVLLSSVHDAGLIPKSGELYAFVKKIYRYTFNDGSNTIYLSGPVVKLSEEQDKALFG